VRVHSALCLRVFGEDFTPFGKELRTKKRSANAPSEEIGAPLLMMVPRTDSPTMDDLELEPKENVEENNSL
jgi:hypothetical protein